MMFSAAATAQKNIAERQYWLDGNIAGAQTLAESPTSVSIEGLKSGIHSLTVRVKDSEGLWSSQVARYFIKPYADNSASTNSIAQHQYWIDGNLQAAVTSGSKPQPISVSSLNAGLHTFTVRVQDQTGTWSSQVAKCFIKPYTEISVEDKEIVQHQYWIDGNVDAIVTLNQKDPIDVIDIEGLKQGLHSLTVRVKDNTGVWSSQVAKYFIVKGDETVEEATITRYMYWFDDETDGFKTGPLTSATGTMDIDISDVEAGTHTLWWRCGDSKGAWSEARSVTFESRSFYDYTVPESGVGTFSADVNLELPDGLQAHFCTYLKEVDEGLAIKIISIDGNVISANTGMLMSGTGGETYRLKYTAEPGATNESNKLVAVVESEHIPATNGLYTNFMMKGGRFVKILEEDESVMMPAHRAYLPLLTAEVANANVIGIIWDDDTVTGLDGVAADDNRTNPNLDGTIYNLQGQKVDHPTRGIYIINGKKVVIK